MADTIGQPGGCTLGIMYIMGILNLSSHRCSNSCLVSRPDFLASLNFSLSSFTNEGKGLISSNW